MKRYLLFVIAFVCVSIGMQIHATPTIGTTTWCQNNSYAAQENVLTIEVTEPGELATAIASQDFSDVQILHIGAGSRSSLITLSAADITALSNVNVKTIEMMRAYVEPFTLTNSNVERIILPYNWTKEQVKAVGEANSTSANFECCISTNDQDAKEGRTGDAALIAYLKKANTLKDAIMRTWNDAYNAAPLGSEVHQGGGDCSRLKYLTVMGNICARDISRQGVYDANGHYVTRGIPDENSTTFNINTAGETYYMGMTTGMDAVSGVTPGALDAHTGDLYYLDLRDASLSDEYAADIVFPYSRMGGSNLKEIWMPQDPNFKTVPADYLNTSCCVRQICIPGNIENIKTRAFAGTSGTGRMTYIWTTGPDSNGKYDNGAAFVSGGVTTWKFMNNTAEGNVAMTEADYNSFQYGTFTLPAGLKLIERFAFSGSYSVSDVYVLNPHAPECHVDAFSTVMYLGNNTLQPGYIKEGIVSREAYRNDSPLQQEYKYVTILHYPRETTDPDIQRYTDPTREYSIATGDRDGNGSTIYYPNHSEMTYAYHQGSFGYLWKAWDDSRNWYDMSLKMGYGSNLPTTTISHSTAAADVDAQARANQRWIDNQNVSAIEKADRSFYDVTTGGHNMPNETNAPAGLNPYYENRYSGYDGVLYPQMEATVTTEPIGEKQKVDAEGNLLFKSCPGEGDYVKVITYEPAENGGYVQVATFNSYQGTQTSVEGVSTYYSDNQGSNVTIPKVQDGYFVEDGTKPVYTAVDKNNDAIGAQDQYYTKSGDTYTESNLMFNSTYYYPTGNNIDVPVYSNINYDLLVPNKTYYTLSNGEYTEVLPNFNGTWKYYDESSNTYVDTNKLIDGVWTYYKFGWHNNAQGQWVEEMYEDTPYLGGSYYYVSGTENVPEYIGSNHFISGKTWYSYDQNNKTYTAITLNWYNHFTGDYYYVSDNVPNFSSANGKDYNASTVYYTSNTGETVVNPVNFNTTYYYASYDYSYVEYAGQEGNRYNKKESYREWTEADGDADRYCPDTELTYAYNKGNQYDYRGWHQFILNARAYNSIVPMEPLRSFITDNDWWTICEPYDLRYKDMIKFFGTDMEGFPKQIPYLSKLMYVIRDVENQRITLMFSKNLMEYQEQFRDQDTQSGKNKTDRVHGYIDDETPWDPEYLETVNPVILHAGVPYLIRPNLWVNPQTNKIEGTRQFDIFKSDNQELYDRLYASQRLGGNYQKGLVYNGIYTVPAYVVGESSDVTENTLAEGETKEIRMKDGTTFTYSNGTINYRGSEVSYRVSKDFTYSFVGTFYKNVMPQYCYFLGWDSKKNQAAFWYSRVQDESGWNWNNETGVICPNFNTDLEIHAATAVEDPARWILRTKADDQHPTVDIQCDDFTVGAAASHAKQYTMGYGATMNLASVDEDPLAEDFGDQEVLSIDEIQSLDAKSVWYNVNGQKLNGKPTQSGVYIMGHKKYVVK